jgi:hypothetical protein
LIAYIEGEADEHIVGLIERSKFLSQRAQQLCQEVKWLTAHSFRRACPDADELGDLYLGLLSRARARAVERHLIRCPFCSRELAQYKDFLGDVPIQPSLAERVVVSLAKIWDGSFLPGQPLAPAYALRGEEGLVLYQTDRLQVSIDVQEDVEKSGHKSIIGIITGKDALTLSVDLWQRDQYLDTAPVDETGGFTFSALLPGAYELVIRGSDLIVLVQRFSL